MSDVERFYFYKPGGYHPVHLGDKFNDRYVVKHKLGHGGYSTVWLARDIRQEQLVALKIIIARESSEEGKFLRFLGQRPQTSGWHHSHNRPSFFPALLDEFTIHGPNGDHHCLVTEVLGPSLIRLMICEEMGKLQLKFMRKMAAQLAQAVSELHECGIVHGDLHPGNILFRTPEMESWTDDDVYNYLGKPQEYAVANCKHPTIRLPPPGPQIPQYLVFAPSNELLVSLFLKSATIEIADFGSAFYCTGTQLKDGVQKTIGTPPAFAAPEVQLKDVLTQACDVWSLGCLVHTLFGGRYIWMYISESNTLVDLTLCFGKLPDHWWKLWENRSKYFDEDGTLKPESHVHVLACWLNVESRICQVPKCQDDSQGMGNEEFAWFRRLMLEIFKLNPKERMIAKDVVRYLPPSWVLGLNAE